MQRIESTAGRMPAAPRDRNNEPAFRRGIRVQRRRSLAVGLATVSAVVLLLAAAPRTGFAQPEAAAEPPAATAAEAFPAPSPALIGVGIARHAGGTVVSLDADLPLGFEYFLIEGRNLVIELPGAACRVYPADRKVEGDPFVERIRVAEVRDPRPGTRVVLDLKDALRFTVLPDGPRIVVTLGAPAAAPAAALAPPLVPEAPRVIGIEPFPTPSRFRLTVKTAGEPPFEVLDTGDEARIVLLVHGATLDPSARKTLDLAALDAAVTRVSALPEPGAAAAVRIVADLRQPAVFQVRRDPAGIVIDVSNGPPAAAVAAPPVPAPPAPYPAAVAAAPPPPLEGPPALPARVATAADAPPAYTGRPVTLDFVDADITDILRLLSEVSGMNLITGDEVKGKRTVNMTEIPWDQALDLILKTNTPQLVHVRESDRVLRITTLKRVIDEQAEVERKKLEMLQLQMAQRDQEIKGRENERRASIEMHRLEEEERRKQQEERKRQELLVRRLFAISYGDAKTIAERLKTYQSDRPDRIFELDPRSNTIVVKDLPANVAVMEDVMSAFDVPTPAVMVEARIVEVDSDYTSSLGIQWGGRASADAAHGNATSYAFPNSIGIGGGVQQGSDGINPGTYLVNTPAAGPVGGVALSLGHVADTLSLDVRLTALEKLGKTKILSNPKVLVIQNEDAKINVGQQLPVPKTDAEGNRTVEWKDVGILLAVKPQVTNDGRVFMKVTIEKSRQGASVPTTEGTMFSIDRSGAETKVIVADGETSVIGGIFIQTTSESQAGVPGLSRIPLLGALFRSRDKVNDRKELMIFLTPRIVTAP